jgi:hypothetical protein
MRIVINTIHMMAKGNGMSGVDGMIGAGRAACG